MKRLAVIPIRSGSKGLKDKNILPINGKPLVAYTIETALNSHAFDRVIVSTDSEKYAIIARQYGAEAPFLRSYENSTDIADSWDVVREVVDRLKNEYNEIYDQVMLLQATSPLRSIDDILGSIKRMAEKNANSVQSVTEMEHTPYWSDVLPKDLCMDHFAENKYSNMPRQLIPVCYRLNGAIYLVKTDELYSDNMFRNKCYAYIMPQNRSIDIDNEMDFRIAEEYLDELNQ